MSAARASVKDVNHSVALNEKPRSYLGESKLRLRTAMGLGCSRRDLRFRVEESEKAEDADSAHREVTSQVAAFDDAG